ncbi:HK97 gp10 family phage protein [Bacillus sp. 03113]|uniref:HK97 gp10 family phage protein n=1 Tax=Bacillus sp. 03113 TaxID=2578211 RepID=UPI001143274F|nr:HK97 gp10 family phage protein [Bacillus sp. 03113]
MGSREIFSIDGIGAMISRLDQIEREMEQRIDQTLTRLAEKVIEDAKKLAPVAPGSGDLEASLHVGEVKTMIKSKYIDFGVSSEVDHYATVQHEGFRKTEDGRVIYMSPGPVTGSKPSYKGYTPGKKYLENAIVINERLIIDELRNALAI